MRPCSRCGGDLLLQWTGPWGSGVWMELCPACYAERPAAGAFIRWHLDPERAPRGGGGGGGPRSTPERR
ncbi:DUF6300 family protein, partial [Streptomyces massasporeus]|uniref:DUF6300 family protein n=1 Tax=Streptomyces massasporeus TaxID=67324 RepID=UPI00369E5F65